MNFYLESYGCSANTGNAEIIAGLLEKAGLIRVSKPENSDVLIINTCIVKEPTEHLMLRRMKELSLAAPDAKLIVSGCMPDAELELVRRTVPNASVVGSHHVKAIVDSVKKTLSGKRVEVYGYADEVKLSLPHDRANPAIAIVPISEGCLGNCSYCIVRFAKGKLFSYPLNSIISEIEDSINSGIKEIWLTSQDNSAYGLDYAKTSQLPALLSRIDALKGSFWVRVGMMNPDHILPIADELAEAIRSMKIFKFIHIPVQSGSNSVLKRMRRKYTVEEFKEIISVFRRKIPRITVATDIICGFPSETEEEFQETINLIRDVKMDFVNISRFWAMKGTDASAMPGQINGNETKKRSTMLKHEMIKIALEKNQKEIGAIMPGIIDEELGNGNYIARTEFYKPVEIKFSANIGKYGNKTYNIFKTFKEVKITGTDAMHLKGEIAEKDELF